MLRIFDAILIEQDFHKVCHLALSFCISFRFAFSPSFLYSSVLNLIQNLTHISHLSLLSI